MDETEITNEMYHDFVNYVRDSIVRQRLAERANELGYSGDKIRVKMVLQNMHLK